MRIWRGFCYRLRLVCTLPIYVLTSVLLLIFLCVADVKHYINNIFLMLCVFFVQRILVEVHFVDNNERGGS